MNDHVIMWIGICIVAHGAMVTGALSVIALLFFRRMTDLAFDYAPVGSYRATHARRDATEHTNREANETPDVVAEHSAAVTRPGPIVRNVNDQGTYNPPMPMGDAMKPEIRKFP